MQIYFRAVSYFSRLLHKDLATKNESLVFDNKTLTIVHIILFLINKISIFSEIVYKYLVNLYKEERKLLDHISDSFSEMFKFNGEFKGLFKEFTTIFKLVLRKINFFFNFNVSYGFNNILINVDKELKVTIKIKHEYKLNVHSQIKPTQQLLFLEEVFGKLFELKKLFSQFILSVKTKLENDHKVLQIMKEDKLRNMKITSLNMNATRAKGFINEVNNSFEKITPYLEKLKQVFLHSSWEYAGLKDNSIYKSYLNLGKIVNFKEFNQAILKEYCSMEKGVPYNEAIKNKRMIKELIDKENQLNKDKENFQSKVKEYEDEIKNYECQLLEEKNNSDLIRMTSYELETEISLLKGLLKENNIDYDKDKLSNAGTNLTSNANNNGDVVSNFKEQFEDLLKGQKNLTQEDYEILSFDVESGKQR